MKLEASLAQVLPPRSCHPLSYRYLNPDHYLIRNTIQAQPVDVVMNYPRDFNHEGSHDSSPLVAPMAN